MSMWTIVKETLSILGCDDIESLPEREQALIGECCYHRVPAKAIAEMIRALRRECGGMAAPPASIPAAISIPLNVVADEAEPQARLGGIVTRLAARRLALEEDERGAGGRELAPAA